MNSTIILEAPEPLAYYEHENTCPFCDGTFFSIVSDMGSTYYTCGSCNNDWSVLGEAA